MRPSTACCPQKIPASEMTTTSSGATEKIMEYESDAASLKPLSLSKSTTAFFMAVQQMEMLKRPIFRITARPCQRIIGETVEILPHGRGAFTICRFNKKWQAFFKYYNRR